MLNFGVLKPKIPKSSGVRVLSLLVPALHWGLFMALSLYGIFIFEDNQELGSAALIQLKPFSLLLGITVVLMGAVISQYAKNYLEGFEFQERFMGLTLGFTFSVLLLISAESLILMVLAWMSMGFHMSRLIGVDRRWPEALVAQRVSARYFGGSTLLFALATGILANESNSFTLTELLSHIDQIPKPLLLLSSFLLIVSAIIQSALFPFHRWLLSSMTAPTPASGLMHAGFVNGAGILLSLFAPIIIEAKMLSFLLVLGGSSAILAQFSKLIQVKAKHKLACSTIAQMGFMVMQCGLGFFNAAVAHLILHGFYKAYLFLSAGEGMAPTQPLNNPHIHISRNQALVVGIYGIGGALLFSWLTGKGISWSSGLFLSMIIALTVGQLTYNVVKLQSLTRVQRLWLPPVVFSIAIGLYSLLYSGVNLMMSDMPGVLTPQPLSLLHGVFALVFVFGFFVMKLGLYLNTPGVYVKLMNLTQPDYRTIFFTKTNLK